MKFAVFTENEEINVRKKQESNHFLKYCTSLNNHILSCILDVFPIKLSNKVIIKIKSKSNSTVNLRNIVNKIFLRNEQSFIDAF